ncbi:MAG TPA: AMP-binding protein [Candidatus Scybalocola faecavium]|nr:AMP-binding protein [Candidatus Scybalocola faecavium]
MITYENTKTIYDLVQHAGKEYGERVFIRYENNDVIYDVTYRQFADECQAIAAWTKEQDAAIGHKVQVGLMGSSSHHYLAVMLGVMSNGNTVVPLDVQLNVENFSDCLNRSDVDILFYDWEHHPLVEGAKEHCPRIKSYISLQHGKHVPCSDNILKEFAGRTVTPNVSENDCAMILFTSGTTGRGKGVMLSNRNLIDNTFTSKKSTYSDDEIFLNILPIHHIFCITSDVLVAMRHGFLLCLNQDMSKLAQHLLLFEPTSFRVVPMVAKALYNRFCLLKKQNPQRSVQELKADVYGHRIRRIVCGGGYLTPELAKNYMDLGISIGQGYGMSECSPVISSPDWSRPDKIASVGKIVDRCQVRIVDGEIQVKSPSVMMGYYKDPENTAKAITEDGWLCTGDLGYVDDENFLYLTGRKKNLIILSNGENVAPEEIENMFTDETIVEDILVFEENDTITAEIYPNFKYAEACDIEDIEGAVGESIAKINQKLPSFKRILNYRIRKDPFEKTSSRKIIRSHYFSQKQAERDSLAKLVMPKTDMQQKIYDCVAGVLGHQHFGIDTDFYRAGMDSMGSVMLLTDLSEKLNFSITLDDLMAHASVEKLEAYYNETLNEEKVDYSVRPVYPLTNLQIYFAYVMRGNTTANLPSLIHLDPSVDLVRLQKAVIRLFDIHPGLKSIIQLDEGVYKSFRDDSRQINIPIIRQGDAEFEETRKHLLVPYMYEKDEPLYHAGIYQTDSANYLFLDIAHIVGDGMTLKILFEDLNDIYAGKPVEKENYTLFEYVLDEKARDAKGKREQDVAYYLKLTKDMHIRKSILTLKNFHDLDHGENASLKGRFRISPNQLNAFCRKNRVSENVMFLTAYNYCISIFSNEKDAVCTSIHSGRTDSRWTRLAGPLFTSYLFRYTNVPHETVPALLSKSARQIMETMRCHLSALHADEMFFQYQGDILNLDEIGGAPAHREPIQLDSLPFHLQVMSNKKGFYFYELRYWKNRFDEQQLKIFMECLDVIMEAMLTEPSVRRLKKHLPEHLFPKHYFVEAGAVNEAAGYELIHDVPADTKVKAYVFDETCRKQPFGAWGNLYIMDHPTKDWTDKITNPYGPGVLYQTGLNARILPDGNLDILETCGRTVMTENLTGRAFLDLGRLERVLQDYEGIDHAEAYIAWSAQHRPILCADISGTKEPDMDKLNQYLAANCEEVLIPKEIHFTAVM